QPLQAGAVVFPAPPSSDRVLIAGVVVSEQGQDKTNATDRLTYNYIDVPLVGAIVDDGDDPPFDPKAWPYRIRTSHRRGRMPAGENLGMLDGSARWRKFGPMIPRTITSATFWW